MTLPPPRPDAWTALSLGLLAVLAALLLLPQHVARQRAYFDFVAALAARGPPAPLFVGPRAAAYAFDAPPGHVRQPGSFQCVWFCALK